MSSEHNPQLVTRKGMILAAVVVAGAFAVAAGFLIGSIISRKKIETAGLQARTAIQGDEVVFDIDGAKLRRELEKSLGIKFGEIKNANPKGTYFQGAKGGAGGTGPVVSMNCIG